MNTLFWLLILLVQLYSYVLLIRIVVEMIASFSRNFRPPRWFSLLAEPLFLITDPPLRLLRRLIPPLRLGNVALDLSVLVLFFLLQLLIVLLGSASSMYLAASS
ncbi:YggT family protein [Corynebacterium choanae]|uniref:YGGT family protein n=1 Tax=Corynebacterium choanae TaxID=1862358 RepID=A0A3G6J754_9CORY|nr:YggT family protein [Corynebacterium choanae]AZA13941.1 YGGT family protein [Corynebacterium choanae]